jgi:glycosyltransferase involved in cell wall biosynthesis
MAATLVPFSVLPLGRRGRGRAALEHFVADVGRELERGSFDVSHAMLPVPSADIYQPRGGSLPRLRLANLQRRTGLARLLAEWGYRFNRHRRLLAALERRVANDPDITILPGSKLVADEFARFYGRRENVRVVFNAAEAPPPELSERAAWRREVRKQLALADDEPLFLSIANNFRLKGGPELLSAFSEWGKPGKLLLVGDTKGLSASAQAAQSPAAERCVFLPPTSDIFRYYAAADAVVLLSWQDACSRVILEATRWGIPSLTTRRNGACEVLEGGAGVVVDSPRDTAGILAGLDRLADPAERAKMAELCRLQYDFLGIARHVEELEQVYRLSIAD